MKVVTNFSTTLSASITSTQTTVPVNSIQTSDATPHTLTIADLDNEVFLTIEPGTSREELVLCTGITDNGDGSGIFSGGTRGLLFYGSDTSGNSGNRYAHQAGSEVRISNVHYIFDELVDNSSDETIGGVKTFTSFPVKSGILIPTVDGQFSTKKYVDQTATGSATYDQNIVSGVAGESVIAGNLVYFKVADGRWWKTDATTAATVNGVIFGFAQGTATAGVAVNILIGGIDKNQSGLTAGVIYYASDTHGAISASAGTVNRPIGQGLTTTSIVLNQFFVTNPTAAQIAAMVGDSITIAVGAGNKFVTQTGMQERQETYATSSGSANAYVLTLSPAVPALLAGQEFEFNANFGNSGAATLAVNGLTAKAITKLGTNALVSGDIVSGQVVKVKYDGTQFQLLSPTASSSVSSYIGTQVSNTSTTQQNIDSTFTTGFLPTTITIYYQINGTQSTTNKNSVGIAVYSGTTLKGNLGYVNIADSTNLIATSFVNTTSGPTAGTGSGSDTKVDLSVLSVSSTGFVIRAAYTTVGGGNIAAAKYNVVATY